MAKTVFAPAAQWLILELSEYFTLRNRGLLHALPASRYVSEIATFSEWYRALPPAWDNGRHFVVKATRNDLVGELLRFQEVEPNTFFALQPENHQDAASGVYVLEFLRSRLGTYVSAAAPFAETIKRIRFAQKQFPYGLAIISLADYETLVTPGSTTGFLAPNTYLPADSSLELSSWRHHLPDFEEENYALVLELKQPVIIGSPIPRHLLTLSPVYPLTKRGEEILRIEKPGIELRKPWFEDSFVRPVLDERILAERLNNAEKLASLVLSKPSKEMQVAHQLLVQSWQLRQGRDASVGTNRNGLTFWDFLVDYDRTGERALAIVNTDRGYLQDLFLILGRFLKHTRLASGSLTEQQFKHTMEGWSSLAEDTQLDVDAYRVFTKPPKNHSVALNQVAQVIAPVSIQMLMTGFLFLKLRRELGDLEQEPSSEKLRQYEQIVGKDKSELHLALYAIGLLFPFKTFVELYANATAKPAKSSPQKRAIAPGLFESSLPDTNSSSSVEPLSTGDLKPGDTKEW